MSDFRNILENRMEEEYKRQTEILKNRLSIEDYHNTCGYLRAISDVGEWIKEIIQKLNNDRLKEGK